MRDLKFWLAALLVACFAVLSTATADCHAAGLFGGSRVVTRQRIQQPRVQVQRFQVQRVQQFVAPAVVVPHAFTVQQFAVPFTAPAVVVPQQQLLVPQAILQPSQRIIYSQSGALILH